jgi:hypothetical protein
VSAVERLELFQSHVSRCIGSFRPDHARAVAILLDEQTRCTIAGQQNRRQKLGADLGKCNVRNARSQPRALCRAYCKRRRHAPVFERKPGGERVYRDRLAVHPRCDRQTLGQWIHSVHRGPVLKGSSSPKRSGNCESRRSTRQGPPGTGTLSHGPAGDSAVVVPRKRAALGVDDSPSAYTSRP